MRHIHSLSRQNLVFRKTHMSQTLPVMFPSIFRPLAPRDRRYGGRGEQHLLYGYSNSSSDDAAPSLVESFSYVSSLKGKINTLLEFEYKTSQQSCSSSPSHTSHAFALYHATIIHIGWNNIRIFLFRRKLIISKHRSEVLLCQTLSNENMREQRKYRS